MISTQLESWASTGSDAGGYSYGGGGGGGGIGAPTGNPSLPLPTPATAIGLSSVAGATAILSNPSLTNTATSTTSPVLLPNVDKLPSVIEALNIQVAAEGFGSYLTDILPEDDAKAAGAFSATMQQINNILNVDFEKFAQVVSSIEIANKGLPSINGTDIPVNTPLADSGFAKTALGSGPNGTYTTSDFFGAMSGLPYMWKTILSGITDLQTTTLATIYQNLYLALTWEQSTAIITPGYTTSAVENPPLSGTYDYYYQITSILSFSGFDGGGGYGRDGAAAPTATVPGATLILTVDTNPNNVNSTYGQVLSGLLGTYGSSVYYASGASPTPSAPPTTLTVTIQSPPALTPDLDTVVQNYINAANAEIAIIRTTNPIKARNLNMAYDATGTQLTIEQRARYTAIPPVPTETRDVWLNLYPTALMIFSDSVTQLAQNTLPHMSAQTLEMISNLDTAGGQSLVGLMRQERNAARLQEIGIQLDNMIPGELSIEQEKILIANGTINLGNPGINGYTIPAIAQNKTLIPSPAGFYSTTPPALIVGPGTAAGAPTTAPLPAISYLQGGFVKTTEVAPGDPALLLTLPPGAAIPATTVPGVNSPIATVGTLVPSGQGAPLDVGQALPGSLAPSKAINLLPPTLSVPLTSSTLAPASFSVQEAIEEVIKCNCDCWV
jgi:hypothetical protein